MALRIPTRRASVGALRACVVLFVAAASCGGEPQGEAPGTVEEYVALISATAGTFDEERAAALAEDYPFEEELIEATALYGVYQQGLEAASAITPPPEVAPEHADLVARFATMQEEVGRYLDKAKLEGGFTFDSLNEDPAVAHAVGAFFIACDRLVERLRALDAEGVPAACALG